MSQKPSPQEYGFTAVPRDLDKLLEKADPERDPPKQLSTTEILSKFDKLTEKIHKYAREQLPELTYNHSMRVICFGLAIQMQYIRHPALSHDAFVLAALLHDLGTAPQVHSSTSLSFEYSGGLLAHSLLLSPDHQAPIGLAESVAEAIIRHQDIGTEGNLTIVGAVLQIATVLDNTGKFLKLLDKGFVREVCSKWPRISKSTGETWTGCFAGVVQREMDLKPWTHTTSLGSGFVDAVKGNKALQEYER